jgi:hypothetical protein
MSYDPSREDDKLEARILREIDRRFTETNNNVLEVKEQIEMLDAKIDTKFETIAERKRENRMWTVRLIITTLISFLMGSGVIGFLQLIQKVVEK